MDDNHLPEEHKVRSNIAIIFSVIENGWFQLMLGIVAVFFGIVDGRYIAIISGMLPLAIHRSNSLSGTRRAKQAAIYVLSFFILFGVLWIGGIEWNKDRDNSPLIKAIADAVGAKVYSTVGKLIVSDSTTVIPSSRTEKREETSSHSKTSSELGFSLLKVDNSPPFKVGDIIWVDLYLHENALPPRKIWAKERSVITNFYPYDPHKQLETENTLWKMQDENKDSGPMQLTNAEGESVHLASLPISEEGYNRIVGGGAAEYFLVDLVDKQGRILYEFCGFRSDPNRTALTLCTPREHLMPHSM
jgi:hypothetical protein